MIPGCAKVGGISRAKRQAFSNRKNTIVTGRNVLCCAVIVDR
jgi:hypothetical protein